MTVAECQLQVHFHLTWWARLLVKAFPLLRHAPWFVVRAYVRLVLRGLITVTGGYHGP